MRPLNVSPQWVFSGLLSLSGLLSFSATAEASPRSLSHEDPAHVVRLYQDPQRSLALLHDVSLGWTELSSLAGGCRIRLHWERSGPMRFGQLKPISNPRALMDTLRAERREGTKGGATRFTLTHEGGLTLKNAYSSGCALPNMKWAQRAQGRTRTVKSPLQMSEAPLWRPLSLKRLPSGERLLSDEGLYVLIARGRGQLIKEIEEGGQVSWRGEKVTLKVTLLSAHEPLTPLPDRALKLSSPATVKGAPKPECALSSSARSLPLPCERLKVLLGFLSYQEGVYEGLGEGVSARGAPALLGASLIADYLPLKWSQVALGGALDQGLKWPAHYKTKLRRLDGRFAALPLLSQLLTRLGATEAEAFLKSKRGWRMWGSMFTSHLRGLMRLASHFANRPARRYLLRTGSTSDEVAYHDLTSNITLMPWALSAAASLLKVERYAPLLGARPGEAKRLAILLKAWRKASHLFERRLEVYEARRRGELWSTKVLEPPSGEPWLGVIYDVDVLSQALSLSPEPPHTASHIEDSPVLSGLSFLGGVLGSPTASELAHLLFLSRPYPIGLMNPKGVTLESPLLLSSTEPLFEPPPTVHPLWLDALYQRALTQQRQRFWRYQTTLQLEERQAEHWEQLKGRERTRALELQVRRSSAFTPPARSPERAETPRHGWTILSCLALTLSAPPPPSSPQEVPPSELGP